MKNFIIPAGTQPEEEKENEFTHLSRHDRICEKKKTTKHKSRTDEGKRKKKIYVIIISIFVSFLHSINIHIKSKALIFSLHKDMKKES